MTIHFSIHYKTQFGQNLYICGSHPLLGGNDLSKALPLEYGEKGIWSKSLKIENVQERLLSYRYFIKDKNGDYFYEVGQNRSIALHKNSKEVFLNDSWQGNDSFAPFLTSPFTDIFYNNGKVRRTQLHTHSKELIIRVTTPLTGENEQIYICGNCPQLGNWNPEKAPVLKPVSGAKWEIHFHSEKLPNEIEFKFVKMANGKAIWESGENRVLVIPEIEEHSTFSQEYSMAEFPFEKPRFFGTAIPVFSLRSKNSCGCGEFYDLKVLGDWASITGQNIIQILPINDTTSTHTWTDSYPYSGISVMALHPIYINIPGIGPIKEKKAAARYNKERKELESLDAVDYERVISIKNEMLKIQFETYKEDTWVEPAYLSFYKKNKTWLLPYAAFCTLRDKYNTSDFSNWGKERKCSVSLIKRMISRRSEHYQTMLFHIFIQYHLHKQLVETVQYLHSKRVILKGDIPIGITPNSADAWSFPELFNFNQQAGAPPDDFSKDGQNWGFPTYNWEKMEEDRFKWWKERLGKMSEYFDAYRIDHVLGFFRIWEIPSRYKSGLMGHFSPALPFSVREIEEYGLKFKKEYADPDSTDILFIEDEKETGKFHPRICATETQMFKSLSEEEQSAYVELYNHFFYQRHNELWKNSGYKKLPELLSASNMLTCAEDLGMIPQCVPQVLANLKILSLEIQRMPKGYGVKYGNPKEYPYLSVCSTGTHDTSTIRGWWKESENGSQEYYNRICGFSGEAPSECEPFICKKIVSDHFRSNSMLVILPLQDLLSTDGTLRVQNHNSERINIPSNPHHYWRYRMHLTLEKLISSKRFNNKIINLIKSGKEKY
jgi:4-alpha-glucanotransferase